MLVSHHFRKQFQKTDDAAELPFEAGIGIVRVQFIGKQQRFAVAGPGRRHLPDGDFDVAGAIVELLFVQIVEHIEIVGVLERRIDHAEQTGHNRQHPVALIVGTERKQRGSPFASPIEFREIEAACEKALDRSLPTRQSGLLPLPRIALVELFGDALHAGEDFCTVRVDYAIDVGLGQEARIETHFTLPVRADARRASGGKKGQQNKRYREKTIDHDP